MFLQLAEFERPDSLATQFGNQQQQAQNETEIADAIDDESLVAGDRVVVILIPEADQQVGAQPDAFPADEQKQQILAHHQQQHEKNEQVQVDEKARHALVMVHVTEGIDVNQKADAGDDQRHHRGQRVDLKRNIDPE